MELGECRAYVEFEDEAEGGKVDCEGPHMPFGEGNGNPLQYSCLENSMDRSLAGCSLFRLYAEYIIRNAGLEEAQAGIQIYGRK